MRCDGPRQNWQRLLCLETSPGMPGRLGPKAESYNCCFVFTVGPGHCYRAHSAYVRARHPPPPPPPPSPRVGSIARSLWQRVLSISSSSHRDGCWHLSPLPTDHSSKSIQERPLKAWQAREWVDWVERGAWLRREPETQAGGDPGDRRQRPEARWRIGSRAQWPEDRGCEGQ